MTPSRSRDVRGNAVRDRGDKQERAKASQEGSALNLCFLILVWTGDFSGLKQLERTIYQLYTHRSDIDRIQYDRHSTFQRLPDRDTSSNLER